MSITANGSTVIAITTPGAEYVPGFRLYDWVRGVSVNGELIWPPRAEQSIRQWRGQASETVSIPWWARFVDVVLCTPGSGGAGGDGTLTRDGRAGQPGSWRSGTFKVERSWTSMIVSMSAAGSGGAAGESGQPAFGGYVRPDYAAYDGPSIGVSAMLEGGSGYGNATGLSPGDHTAFGFTFNGGAGGARNGNGGAPGGAGGGGRGGTFGNASPGGAGGDGYVWLRFRAS